MRRLVPVAGALLLLVGGCGSDEEAATTTAATTASAEAEVTEPFGEYEREVTQADIDRTASTRVEGPGQEAPPPGTYRLSLNAGVIQAFAPDGFTISQELKVTGGTLEIERYIGRDGIFCADDGPSSYTWELDGEKLILSPKNDTCADRDSVLTGSWTTSG